MSSTPERPLSPSEQVLWAQSVIDYRIGAGLDRIEQAARDCRVEGALRVMLLGTPEHYEYDFEEISFQIATEYMLGPDEIMMALDIAEDRILNEQA